MLSGDVMRVSNPNLCVGSIFRPRQIDDEDFTILRLFQDDVLDPDAAENGQLIKSASMGFIWGPDGNLW